MSVESNRQRAIDFRLPIGSRVMVLISGGGTIVGDLEDAVFDGDNHLLALLVRHEQAPSEPTYIAWQAVVTVDVVEDSINRDPGS